MLGGDTENTAMAHAEVQPQLHRFHTHIYLSSWVQLPPEPRSGPWHQSKNTEKQLKGFKLGLKQWCCLWSSEAVLRSGVLSWTRLLPQGGGEIQQCCPCTLNKLGGKKQGNCTERERNKPGENHLCWGEKWL